MPNSFFNKASIVPLSKMQNSKKEMAMHGSEIRNVMDNDKRLLAYLGIPNAVRLNTIGSSFLYYDASSRTLHEWLCSCRKCMRTCNQNVPSLKCKFRSKHVVHESWTGLDASDLGFPE